MSASKEKLQLVEEIGLTMEERLKISPLAARIYALLNLSSSDGLTFDEIREAIDASKSSTSVNINVLTQLGYIKYFTKPGDRKRYFKVARHFQLHSLELYHQALEREINMIEKINAYKKEHYPDKSSNEASVGDITQTYLRETQSLVKEAIKKISSFRESGE